MICCCDEAGMVDQDSARACTARRRPGWARVALVGDRRQLPGSGAGRGIGPRARRRTLHAGACAHIWVGYAGSARHDRDSDGVTSTDTRTSPTQHLTLRCGRPGAGSCVRRARRPEPDLPWYDTTEVQAALAATADTAAALSGSNGREREPWSRTPASRSRPQPRGPRRLVSAGQVDDPRAGDPRRRPHRGR